MLQAPAPSEPQTEVKQNASIKLPVISTVGNLPMRTEHKMTVINNQPFYQSSGDNSGVAGTWFPFYGLLEHNVDGLHIKGWYIKKDKSALPKEIIDKINELAVAVSGFGMGKYYKDLSLRFADKESILISSVIGGGFWDYPAGKVLKTFLQNKYPEFYANCASYELLPAVELQGEESTINAWLQSHMNQPIKELMRSLHPEYAEKSAIDPVESKDPLEEKIEQLGAIQAQVEVLSKTPSLRDVPQTPTAGESPAVTRSIIDGMKSVGEALISTQILAWAFDKTSPAPLRPAVENRNQPSIRRTQSAPI